MSSTSPSLLKKKLKPPKGTTPEGIVKRAILDYLATRKDTLAFPILSGGSMKGGKFLRPNKHFIPGTPDIMACVAGRFVGIEVKAGKNKASEEQKAVLERLRHIGAIAFVAYDVEQVIARLDYELSESPAVDPSRRHMSDPDNALFRQELERSRQSPSPHSRRTPEGDEG